VDYIEEVFGERVTRRLWIPSDRLPMYFRGLYRIEYATIGNIEALILLPQAEPCDVAAIKKHFKRLKDEWNGPMALELLRLSRQRKQTLIAERIPFIVPGKQLFLPFLGAFLQERHDSEDVSDVYRLQPSAQMLLFYFIYGKNKPLYLSRVPQKFAVSAMTVSRAAAQLVATGLLETYKDGAQKVLTSEFSPKELFEKARVFLSDPVRKRFYIDITESPDMLFIAGESALSQKSMLGEPDVPVYGTAKSLQFVSQTARLLDSAKQRQVELWRYDPTRLSSENCADALSLALSLADLRDERVEMSVDEMLKEVWS
jgi:hypothetical protein